MSSDENEKNCAAGKRLKEERERIGLSQEEFGLKLGTSKRTVVNWEGGNSAPDVFDLIVMGEKMGIDTNFIIHSVRVPLTLAQLVEATPAEKAAADIRLRTLSEENAWLLTKFAEKLDKL